MKIQPTNNYQNLNPQFKAAYPVYHWVAETNAGYKPVMDSEITRKLQRTIVSLSNKFKKKDASALSKKVGDYLSKCDIDFRRICFARSFYDRFGGWNKTLDKPKAISYLITGKDALNFDKNFRTNTKQSIDSYNSIGQDFINSTNKKLYDADGIEYGLHTKFEIIRTKTGKIKEYKLVNMKFCPESGERNPFERLGYTNSKKG